MIGYYVALCSSIPIKSVCISMWRFLSDSSRGTIFMLGSVSLLLVLCFVSGLLSLEPVSRVGGSMSVVNFAALVASVWVSAASKYSTAAARTLKSHVFRLKTHSLTNLFNDINYRKQVFTTMS